MIVKLMSTMNDKKVLHKTVNTLREIDCAVKESSSILEPVLIVSLDCIISFSNLNYAYIDAFERYYFIDDIIVETGRTVEIKCSVDVLQTYNSEIDKISTLIKRQEYVYSDFLTDTELPIRVNRVKVKKNVGEVGDGNYYYLTVNGGGEGIA